MANEEQGAELEAPHRLKLVVKQALDEAAESLYRRLTQQMPVLVAERRAFRAGFESRLRERWQRPLDLYEAALAIAQEAGSTFNKKHRPRAAEEGNLVFRVLVGLHARACLTASEVLSALESGHATAAHARWRTLHELLVVANLIRNHGNDLAERYLLHEAVESARAAEEDQRHCTRLGDEPLDPGDLSRLRARKEELCQRFGREFGNSYGWAAQAVRAGNPSLADLERAAGLEHLRPYYRMASHGIHPNAKGLHFSLQNPHDAALLVAGPSNAGLADPGHGALMSLLQCTTIVLGSEPEVETVATCQALGRLIDEAGEAFLEAHNQLLRDEHALRQRENQTPCE